MLVVGAVVIMTLVGVFLLGVGLINDIIRVLGQDLRMDPRYICQQQ